MLWLHPAEVQSATPDACELVLADGFEGDCDTDFDIDIPVVEITVTFTINGDPPPGSQLEHGEISLRNLDTGDFVLVGDSAGNGGVYLIRTIAGRYEAFWELLDGGSSVPSNSSAALGTFEFDTDGPIAVDMPMTTIEGDFTLDGAPPPVSPLESADIYLRNPATGDEVLLGNTADGSYLRNVVPGTYDVVYALSQGGLVVPLNANRVLTQAVIPDAPEIIFQLDVALQSGVVSGDIRFEGAVPPTEADDYGDIRFHDLVTGDAIPIGDTRNGSYSGRLLVGAYHVHYGAVQAGAVAPVNSAARIVEGYDLPPGAATLDLDIPVADLEAMITLNGEVPPTSVFEDGRIVLWSAATGDEALLGVTSENGGILEARVIPGVYEALWELDDGGTQVPANTRAALGAVTVEDDVPIAIDVPMVSFAGNFLLNGAPPIASALETGRISVVDRTRPDEVFLGETYEGSFLQNIVPGAYEIFYRLESGGSIVPINGEHIVSGLCVEDVGSEVVFEQDIHLRSVHVAGDIRFNGELPVASVFETGDILFRDPVTGDEVLVGKTMDGEFSAILLIGEYEVFYRLENGGSIAPRNTHARIGTFSICPAVE